MIQKAAISDVSTAAELALALWPDADREEILSDVSRLVSDPEAVLFLAYAGETPIGFAQCQLRHDYVEGTDSSPVGYLEGIFVKESHRRQGYAKLLLSACEVWARQQGCREFASDCELANQESLRFHLKAGFTEANRIICFTKAL